MATDTIVVPAGMPVPAIEAPVIGYETFDIHAGAVPADPVLALRVLQLIEYGATVE